MLKETRSKGAVRVREEYSHSEMVDETQPAAGMLEEHVESLLKGLALLMMEHVFGLEGLVDRQVDRIVRIRHAGLVGTRRLFLLLFGRGHVIDVLLALSPPVFPLHRRRHPLMVCLAEARRTKATQKGESARGRRRRLLRVRAVVLGVLGLAAGGLQRGVLRLEAVLGLDELVLAALQGSVGGRGAAPLFREPRALVLASWKTLVVVRVTWAFPGYCGPGIGPGDVAPRDHRTRYARFSRLVVIARRTPRVFRSSAPLVGFSLFGVLT